MKKLILLIVAIMFLGGCATNHFAANVSYDNPAYVLSKKFCKNASDSYGYDYNKCMNDQYFCLIEMARITGAQHATKDELKEMDRKSDRILKKHGLFKRYYTGKCSYCEALKYFKKDW